MILVPEAEFEHRHEGQCNELKAGVISEELAHQHCYLWIRLKIIAYSKRCIWSIFKDIKASFGPISTCNIYIPR